MQKQFFYKYHGAGNDFILADNRTGSYVLDASEIRNLCHRQFGIGADGLIIIEKSNVSDFKMIYYNADGLEGSMCGNGGRCVAVFAHTLGIASNAMVFEAFDGLHQAEIISNDTNEYTVRLSMQNVLEWKYFGKNILINTGSPHCVIKVDDLSKIDVEKQGREIRYDKTIADNGVNVNFLSFKNSLVNVRTYERGVERETLSCGTGVTAAAIAASLWSGGNSFEINTLGGKLLVSFEKQKGIFSNIVLTGPVAFVFKAERFI